MKKHLVLGLAVSIAASSLVGCSGSNDSAGSSTASPSTSTQEQNKVKEITVPHYKVGQNVGAKFFVPQVDRFNAKYKGQYKINLEEIPQDGYQEKIKQLAQQDKLPPLIEGGDPEWFESYVIPNNKYYDLSEFISSNPEMETLFIDDALTYNTTEDGKVVSMPVAVSRPIGLFYNSSLYNPEKAISEMTLDEFLTSLGDNKVALMTSENAWTTMLLYTSLIAQQEGGPEALRAGVTAPITDFNNDVFIGATAKLQEIAMNYGSSNMLGAAFADAANNFMSKNSAVICNGSWMGGDFAAGSEDKWSNGFDGSQVSASIYPGNIAIDNVQINTWWIPSNVSEDDAEVALAFLEFMNSPEELESYLLHEGGVAPNLETSEAFKTKQAENVLLNQLNSSIGADTTIVPSFEHAVPNSVAQQELGKLLPKLFDGSFTPEEFCEELTKKAQEAVQ